MALVLVKQDGTGLLNSNSYASAADGDLYHQGHLYGAAWNWASLGTKEAALVMATRLIDLWVLVDALSTLGNFCSLTVFACGCYLRIREIHSDETTGNVSKENDKSAITRHS